VASTAPPTVATETDVDEAVSAPAERSRFVTWWAAGGVVVLAAGIALFLWAGLGGDIPDRLGPRPPGGPDRSVAAERLDAAIAAVATKGTLHLRPVPSGGAVHVEGQPRGSAPLELAGLPANRALRVQIIHQGFEPYDQLVTLEPGGKLVLEPRLRPKRSRRTGRRPSTKARVRAKGTLSVNSEPWSTVYVDGAKVGNTPLLGHPLPAGRHKVRLVNPVRKVSATRKVTIRPNRETRLSVELER
jgi:hypothetical protein